MVAETGVTTIALFGAAGNMGTRVTRKLKAIEEAKRSIFQPDWKKVFETESLRASIASITGD